MKKLLQILFLLLTIAIGIAKAEGSQQLTPNTSATSAFGATDVRNTTVGYLQHDDNGTQTISFGFLKPSTWTSGTETFSADYRLYIRLKTNEKLYYGVRRIATNETNITQGKLILTLKAGTGTTVQTTTLTNETGSTNGSTLKTGNTNNPVNGVIANAAQAAIGPKLGTAATANGYNALVYTNTTGTEQDFWIEFTQEGEATMSNGTKKSWYDLWDFTVVSGTSTVMPGRLFSKQWSFSAGGSANLLSATFALYPLIPSETDATKYYVKKFTLAGMRPFGFRFVSNKFGSSTSFGTTFEERRKSQLSRSGYTEYATFVNNPDAAIWPSASAPTFNIISTSGCNGTEGQMTFSSTSNVPTVFTVVVDLNGTTGYQANTADVLLEKSFPAGTNTLVWNGKNGFGATVPSGTQLKYYYTSGAAPVNFPIFDAEGNKLGFKSENIRPVASTTNDLLYWDDSNLPIAKFPSPQTNFTGSNSATGTHLWGATTDDGDGYTVNTWTYGYTNFSQEQVTFVYACSSFGPSRDPVTLPVSLISFTAAATTHNVMLQWATASEKDNDYFQVERSLDGITFAAIGKVTGNGTSQQKHSYAFTDNAAQAGTTYYRLKQVDFDGKFEYSPIRAAKRQGNAVQVSLYPNPATSALNVDLASFPAGTYTVKIATLTGLALKQTTAAAGQPTTLDVQNIPAGAYMLIVEGGAVKQTTRFLKI